MKFRPPPYNRILLALILLTAGCQTDRLPGTKEASTLRLHLETRPDPTERTQPIVVFTESPLKLNVAKEPILDEASVAEARIIEADGRFAIAVTFTTHGKLVLETTSHTHRNRHIGIFSQFPHGRWIGAFLINRRLSDGTILFRMDGTREEADRLVSGLNKVAAALKKRGEQY